MDFVNVFCDKQLARRLEACEAHANVTCVETRARLFPEIGAVWRNIAGTFAMFDGPSSPLTQTFGLGLFAPPTVTGLDEIEAFFAERGAGVLHEVSPLADSSVIALLIQRQCVPLEFSSVMYLPPAAVKPCPGPDNIAVRLAQPQDHECWARSSAAGWSEFPESSAFMLDLAKVVAANHDGTCFLAESDGRAIATGSMSIHEGVALLAGASTIPEARNRGAQRALLAARLDHARRAGCDLAMMCAAPGSASQRNAERHGFRIAYTRLKWKLSNCVIG